MVITPRTQNNIHLKSLINLSKKENICVESASVKHTGALTRWMNGLSSTDEELKSLW